MLKSTKYYPLDTVAAFYSMLIPFGQWVEMNYGEDYPRNLFMKDLMTVMAFVGFPGTNSNKVNRSLRYYMEEEGLDMEEQEGYIIDVPDFGKILDRC